MILISVVICCYNSASRIRPTLEYLQAQDLSGIEWEVVLVDNNCSDDTVSSAQSCWARDDVDLKVVSEAQPGLSSARDRGVSESVGLYILFCDDDNWLDKDYLRNAFEFMKVNPEYAAVGGWGEVVSDPSVVIPEWFHQFETKYACGKTRVAGDVDTLVGAGMFIRKAVLDELKQSGFQSLLSDRKGSALSSGGDLELMMVLRVRGWKLYFSDNLFFRHYMPADRLTEDYLLRMCHGHGRSGPILAAYRRLIDGGKLSRLFLFMLPLRMLCNILRRRFKIPSCEKASLAERVRLATTAGVYESEDELIATGAIWSLAGRIYRNIT